MQTTINEPPPNRKKTPIHTYAYTHFSPYGIRYLHAYVHKHHTAHTHAKVGDNKHYVNRNRKG